jgi:signal transduction histidine kinase/DNA-binding response OmpR family regulator
MGNRTPETPEPGADAGPAPRGADNGPLRVLVLEDNARDADLVARHLRKAIGDFAATIVDDAHGFTQALEAFAPDIVLADYTLPQFNAPAALKILQTRGSDLPVIIVTGTIGEEKAAECIRLGAADFLIKGSLARLGTAVRQALENRALRREKQAALHALTKSAQRYRELFAAMGNAVMALAPMDGGKEFSISELNPAAARIDGIDRDTAVGRKIREVLPASEIFGLLAAFERVHATGRAEALPVAYYDDGRIRGWRKNSIHKLPTGEVVNVYDDVTESIVAAERLRASEEKYRGMVDNINLGVSLISPEMKVMEMNRQMRQWFPHIRLEAHPTCYEVFRDPPAEGICESCPTAKALKDGSVQEAVMGMRQASGARTFRVVASPIRDGDGRITGAIELLEDITERTELENRLRHAQKMESIGTLAGGIAHDFNNILSAIIGYTELAMLDLEPDRPSRQDLREVLQASQRAKNLVAQILAFSRQQESVFGPVQLRLIAKETIKLLRATLPASIRIEDYLDSGSVVNGDAGQLQQVLMNLCTNAYHAMRADGGTLRVTLEERLVQNPAAADLHHVKPGAYLQLTVADTGSGMDPATLARIFEPYFTTKEKGEGTGLGLSMVYGIVKAHDGAIHVESAPGRGAVFSVYLPQLSEPVEAPAAEEKPVPPPGRERILFVDDEPAIAVMAQRTLEQLGYRVTTRTGSLEALALFRKAPGAFDLVISDMTMPDMNGDLLAGELIRIRPDIPIIVCTGFSENLDEAHLAQFGIRAVALKPLLREHLATLIRRVLDGHP